MNTSQALRFLAKHGWRVVRKGKGSHLIMQKGDRITTLPWRSGQKQLSEWVMHQRADQRTLGTARTSA
jgi:predicted RNA binding protein YcfA (HicA-like mRNA interferase family)